MTDRIVEVLRKHKATTRRIKHPWRKGILLNISACTGCDWGDEDTTEDDHAAHLAERVAEALQLTEETVTGWADGDVIEQRRWVSAWTAVGPKL